MSNLVRDGALVKKVILGLLAAGGAGAGVYYGYSRWKSRPQGKPGKTEETVAESTKTEPSLNLQGPEKGADPTPVLEPTPVQNGPSTPPKPDLSVSGTFEKVSLPDDSSKSFEKVSVPESVNTRNKDAPTVRTSESGSETVMPAGGRDTRTDGTTRSRTEMKVDISPKPTPASPKPVSSVTIPQTKPVAGKEEEEDEENEDDEDDSGDEEDNEDSDASADSQKKAGRPSNFGWRYRRT